MHEEGAQIPSSTAAGLRTGIPATCSTVTVFSLSVSRYVGTPATGRSPAARASWPGDGVQIVEGDLAAVNADPSDGHARTSECSGRSSRSRTSGSWSATADRTSPVPATSSSRATGATIVRTAVGVPDDERDARRHGGRRRRRADPPQTRSICPVQRIRARRPAHGGPAGHRPDPSVVRNRGYLV